MGFGVGKGLEVEGGGGGGGGGGSLSFFQAIAISGTSGYISGTNVHVGNMIQNHVARGPLVPPAHTADNLQFRSNIAYSVTILGASLDHTAYAARSPEGMHALCSCMSDTFAEHHFIHGICKNLNGIVIRCP